MMPAHCRQHCHHAWPDAVPVVAVGHLAGTRRQLTPWETEPLDLTPPRDFQRGTLSPARDHNLSTAQQLVGGCNTPSFLASWWQKENRCREREKGVPRQALANL